MANAPRDDNSITTLLAVSNADGTTPVVVWADPTTHRLLVSATTGLTVGTTTISSGTSGRVLYDNAGVLGELATTGTGNVVLATSPTLTTPTIGVATATSINGLTITTSTGTLTISNGKTLTASNTITFSGTDGIAIALGGNNITLTTSGATALTLPTSGTVSTLAGTEELDNKTLDSSVGKGTWTASGTWTLPAFTLGGDVQFSENVNVLLDSALSADGKWCGISEAGTLGATVAFGELVYLLAADSQWYLTDADADATAGAVKIGMCVVAGVDNGATTILLWGKIRADSLFPALTIGAPVYISTTAGAIQTAQPSGVDDVIRIVGYGNTADELFFRPSNDYITHT